MFTMCEEVVNNKSVDAYGMSDMQTQNIDVLYKANK